MWTYFSFEGGGICQLYCCIVVSLEIDFLRQIFSFWKSYMLRLSAARLQKPVVSIGKLLLRLSLFRLQSTEICLLWLPSDMM